MHRQGSDEARKLTLDGEPRMGRKTYLRKTQENRTGNSWARKLEMGAGRKEKAGNQAVSQRDG